MSGLTRYSADGGMTETPYGPMYLAAEAEAALADKDAEHAYEMKVVSNQWNDALDKIKEKDAEIERLEKERTRLVSANEHWHERVESFLPERESLLIENAKLDDRLETLRAENAELKDTSDRIYAENADQGREIAELEYQHQESLIGGTLAETELAARDDTIAAQREEIERLEDVLASTADALNTCCRENGEQECNAYKTLDLRDTLKRLDARRNRTEQALRAKEGEDDDER